MMRVWPVFVGYVLAIVSIIAFSIVAMVILHAFYPDVPEREMFDNLPGLLAQSLAASAALITTALAFTRPFDLARLRLRPARETGRELAVMILGVLALGQALDSLTLLVGWGDRGALAAIRQIIAGIRGPSLFAAVLVIGVVAGTAEEVFFRGFMQTRLSERWGARAGVVVTAACFALLHVEWRHALLAFGLGLYLGYICARAGSALPAIAAHVVNNALFTVLTAMLGTVKRVDVNVALLVVAAVTFAGCVGWLEWSLRRRTAP